MIFWHQFVVTLKKRRLAMLISALVLAGGVTGAIWYAAFAWVQHEQHAATATARLEANLAAEAVEQRLLRVIERVEDVFDLMASLQRSLGAGEQLTPPSPSLIEVKLRRRQIGFNQITLAGLNGALLWSADPGNIMPPGLVGESAYFRGPDAGQPGRGADLQYHAGR